MRCRACIQKAFCLLFGQESIAWSAISRRFYFWWSDKEAILPGSSQSGSQNIELTTERPGRNGLSRILAIFFVFCSTGGVLIPRFLIQLINT